MTINQLPYIKLTAGAVDSNNEGGIETQDEIVVIED
jgi:hypothetical protein